MARYLHRGYDEMFERCMSAGAWGVCPRKAGGGERGGGGRFHRGGNSVYMYE